MKKSKPRRRSGSNRRINSRLVQEATISYRNSTSMIWSRKLSKGLNEFMLTEHQRQWLAVGFVVLTALFSGYYSFFIHPLKMLTKDYGVTKWRNA